MRDYLEIVVDGNGTVGGKGNTKSFKSQPLSTRFAPCGHKDYIGIDIGNILNGRFHLEGNALLLHILTQAFGNITVEGKCLILNHTIQF